MAATGTARRTPAAKRNTTKMVHVRVSDQLKKDATRTLEAIGISLPEAVRLFMHRVVVERALPLRLDVPNAETRGAIESRRKPRPSRFSTPQDMSDALEKIASER